MSTTLENQTELNPFASPMGSATIDKVTGKSKKRTVKRASQPTLRNINRLSIVADLSYVAVWCCFFVNVYFVYGDVAQLAWIVYCITFFVFWYSTVAGFFRTSSYGAIITPFLLPIPILGVLIFLAAKQGMREFMIRNGYRPRFLGFVVDEPQRQAMEQDPDYTPSLRSHLDGSRRWHVYSLGECWIITGGIGLLVFALGIPFLSSFVQR